jgi:polysaccharide export outer membrane protein
MAFAPLDTALTAGAIESQMPERPEVYRSLFVTASHDASPVPSPLDRVQIASAESDSFWPAVLVGYEATAPAASFRKPERPDLFAAQPVPATALNAPSSQAAGDASFAEPSASPSIAAATGNVLRSGGGALASSSTSNADTPISEFRFVTVSEDALRPIPGTIENESTEPRGDAAARFKSSPIQTYVLTKGQQSTAQTDVGENGGESPNELTTTATDLALPALLANSWGEPLPLAEDATFVSPMPGEIGDRTRVLDGCPYRPGDSGTPAVCGIDCGRPGAPCCATWNEAECIPWSLFGPGEYVGPARPEHVSAYYLRVNDLVTLTLIASRRKEAQAYRIGVGDRIKIEWLQTPSTTDATLDREVVVSPDGTLTLPLVGDVIAVGKSVQDLRNELIELYSRYQREPQITVTPVEVNTAIQDVIKSITSISGTNGQSQALRVTPEGTIQAPGLGSVYVQGLTLDEARAELEARYAAKFGPGLMVSPSLTERAASFVFIGGEVQAPGRYPLEGPTTVMQAITLAGGWNNGGNLRQVVIFRRDENWCLKATKIDIHSPLFGKDPCPTNDVWLRDNDLVIVPKTRILCATDVINLYFTRGVYAAFPINYVYSFSNGSSVTPIVTGP